MITERLRTESRTRFILENYLISGNLDLLTTVARSNKVAWLIDGDGIIINLPKLVISRWNQKVKNVINEVKEDIVSEDIRPSDVDTWNFLSRMSEKIGLPSDFIMDSEKDWYDPDVLLQAKPYRFAQSILRKIGWNSFRSTSGSRAASVHTSREPELRQATHSWFSREFPRIPNHSIKIRDVDSPLTGDEFKIENVRQEARRADWVIVVDDSIQFISDLLDSDVENCTVVNVPLGKIRPRFEHDRLIVLKRHPHMMQEVYPLYSLVKRCAGLPPAG